MSKVSLVFDYPWWFVSFCLLAGAAYALILYFRNKRISDVPRAVTFTMAAARFFAVAIISFLLLSPLLRMITRQVQKPVVVVALDNSSSLVLNKDSAFYREEYPEAMKKFISRLADKFEVKAYSFGDQVREGERFDFTEKQTDMSTVMEEIDTRFTNRNLGAVVLASDGLYNKGQNPVFSFARLNVPVYTVALGDTTIKKDLLISNVIHNRLAYLNNRFPIEVVVDARQSKGAVTTLTISKNGAVLATQRINIASNAFSVSLPFELEAGAVGMQRYRVNITSVEGEVTKLNNTRDFFIDVLDAREKVLILCEAPHPDVAALRSTINANQNYEAESFTLSSFDKRLSDYSLVIMHQLPSVGNPATRIIEQLNAAKLPVFYILGLQSSARAFNLLAGPVNFNSAASGRPDDAEVNVDKDFPLFTLSDALIRYSERLPALQLQFGEYKLKNNGSGLFFIQKGIVKTKQPLLAFSSEGERKIGVLAGEGIWRWKLSDFADHGNHEIFTELVNKIIQYLAVKVDKSFFKVNSKNTFLENESVEFQAELYNESYELINEPEVIITITGSDNKKYNYTFTRTSKAYRLNAGVFPVGDYKYEAKVSTGKKTYTENGVFSVTQLVVEASNTTADHQLLFSLAQKQEGAMYYPGALTALADDLLKREDIKPVIYNPKKLVDVIDLEWIFFLLLFLLTLEWFFRKRYGAY